MALDHFFYPALKVVRNSVFKLVVLLLLGCCWGHRSLHRVESLWWGLTGRKFHFISLFRRSSRTSPERLFSFNFLKISWSLWITFPFSLWLLESLESSDHNAVARLHRASTQALKRACAQWARSLLRPVCSLHSLYTVLIASFFNFFFFFLHNRNLLLAHAIVKCRYLVGGLWGNEAMEGPVAFLTLLIYHPLGPPTLCMKSAHGEEKK